MGLFGNIFSVKGLKKAAATLKKIDKKVFREMEQTNKA